MKTPLYLGLAETIKIVRKQMRSEIAGHQKDGDEPELDEEAEESDEESSFWS